MKEHETTNGSGITRDRELTRKFTADVMLKLIGGAVSLLTAGILWLIAAQVDMQRRMAVMESNRFTAQDAAAIMTRIQSIEVMVARLPNESPKWFMDQFQRLEGRVDSLSAKIDRYVESHATPTKPGG